MYLKLYLYFLINIFLLPNETKKVFNVQNLMGYVRFKGRVVQNIGPKENVYFQMN